MLTFYEILREAKKESVKMRPAQMQVNKLAKKLIHIYKINDYNLTIKKNNKKIKNIIDKVLLTNVDGSFNGPTGADERLKLYFDDECTKPVLTEKDASKYFDLVIARFDQFYNESDIFYAEAKSYFLTQWSKNR